ncbi:MAG: aminopeptidase [Bacteroidetes bacterium]|nr:aminopeptidase [Bacteroidota bacterium]
MKILLKVIKIFSYCLLLFIVGYSVFNFQLVGYGIAQLKGQVKILYNAEPIEAKLTDPNFPDSLKDKLRLIHEIKKFAHDSLGLIVSKNYTKVYDQKGKPVLWVITACRPFSMQDYEWDFPFLGKVSYKGFFEEERGQPELKKIEDLGYDVEYRPTAAWSTLGWFEDPILSNMLRRSEGQLAELIIHELTHTTLYLPGSVDYNENFATFVGEQGAIQFLKYKYGTNGIAYTNYIHYQYDEKIYGDYMIQAVYSLDSLYHTFPTHLHRLQKLHLKYKKIAQIMHGIHQLPLYHPQRYRFDFRHEVLPNNTFFMSFYRYRNQQNEFNLTPILTAHDLSQFIIDQKKGATR